MTLTSTLATLATTAALLTSTTVLPSTEEAPVGTTPATSTTTVAEPTPQLQVRPAGDNMFLLTLHLPAGSLAQRLHLHYGGQTPITPLPMRIDDTAIPTAFDPESAVISAELPAAELGPELGPELALLYHVDSEEAADATAQADAWDIVEKEHDAFLTGETLEAEAPAELAFYAAPEATGQATPAWLAKDYERQIARSDDLDHGLNWNKRYYGPLQDPAFGEEHEGRQSYPIRHRNWEVEHYPGAGNGREVRGPKHPIAESSRGAYLFHEREQGLFYSRDHVQHAWAGERYRGQTPVYRAHEFLIGGGHDDGTWYGGTFRIPAAQHALWDENYRLTGKPGFQIFIEGIVDTDAPGWTYKRQIWNGNLAVDFFSPDGTLLIHVERANGREIKYRFFDLEQLRADGVINARNMLAKSNLAGNRAEHRYRVGIPTPGWKRIVLRYGTAEAATAIKPANSVNGYLASAFVPEWGHAAPPAEPSVVKEVLPASENQAWGVEADGRTYIDYTIAATLPEHYGAPRAYKLYDQPAFGPDITVTELKIIAADSPGDLHLSAPHNGSYTISGPNNTYLPILSGDTHTITVRAYFETNPAATIDLAGRCEPHHGLFNTVTLELQHLGMYQAEACAPYEQDGHISATLSLLKTDQHGNYLPIDQDFAFALQSEDGTTIPLARTFRANGDTLLVKATDAGALTVGKRYHLIETKAPRGLQLLAEPIPLSIERRASGELGLTLHDAHLHPQVSQVTLGIGDALGPNLFTVKVADMRLGELPLTGGIGVGWPLGAGITLLLMACWTRRKLGA